VSIQSKNGVRFHDPILDALQVASEQLGVTLTITSGVDGPHSGVFDPHHSGRAYDVRSQDLSDKQAVLGAIMDAFQDGAVWHQDGGLMTTNFFGWLEDAGTTNEHLHVQVRRSVQPTPN
jgi:hypothetical protein